MTCKMLPCVNGLPRRVSRNSRTFRHCRSGVNLRWKTLRRWMKVIKGFVVVLRWDLTILSVSSNVADYLGFCKTQMTGRSITDYLHPSQLSLTKHIHSMFSRQGDDPMPGCQHSFHVGMKFEFLKAGRYPDTGYKTVRWCVCLMPSTKKRNRAGHRNIISVCFPCRQPSPLSNLVETKLLLPPRQSLGLFNCDSRLFRHIVAVIKSSVPSCSQSKDFFAFLPELTSLLRSRCLRGLFKHAKSNGKYCAVSNDDLKHSFSSCGFHGYANRQKALSSADPPSLISRNQVRQEEKLSSFYLQGQQLHPNRAVVNNSVPIPKAINPKPVSKEQILQSWEQNAYASSESSSKGPLEDKQKYSHSQHSIERDNSPLYRSNLCPENEMENFPSLNYPLNYSPSDVTLGNPEELDFSSEFSFHSDDVVMPVENGIDCVTELVLNGSSPNTIAFDTVNDSCDSKGNIDSLDPIQHPNSFCPSFGHESQGESFEPFDHLLNFTTSDFTSSSVIILDSFSFTADSNTISTGLPMEIDNGVSQNLNSLEKNSTEFNQPAISNGICCSPYSDSPIPFNKKEPSSKPSLLRTLLNKDDVQEKTSSSPNKTQQQNLKLSTHPSSNTSYEIRNICKTKELPIPKISSNKKVTGASTVMKASMELPLPGSLMNSGSRSYTSAQISIRSHPSSGNAEKYGHESESNKNITNPLKEKEKVDIYKDLIDTEDGNSELNSTVNGSDNLPEDLVDLAIEYCSSFDSQEADSLISELREQIAWEKELDPLSTVKSVENIKEVTSNSKASSKRDNLHNLRYFLQESSEMDNHVAIQNMSNSAKSLSLSKNCKPETHKPSLSSSKFSNSQSSVRTSNTISKGSLLRQAVTSPDVDKLIEQIPLGRRLLAEKREARMSKSTLYPQKCPENAKKNQLNSSTTSIDIEDCAHSLENFSDNNFDIEKGNARTNHGITKASKIPTASNKISQIFISVPSGRTTKKSQINNNPCSPLKLRISVSNDVGRKQKSSKVISSSLSSSSSSSSSANFVNCTNSSSEPVSVMVMRKENHRSRRSRTVSTQTDNNPDEVYPALELSPSDIILTPSVYLDTSISLNLRSLAVGSKSPSYSCNLPSSSSRSLISPRDSNYSAVPSPCPSHTSSSSSSLPELEQRLHSLSSPEDNVSSPSFCESVLSSDTSFLQRLLTGELNKDRYEKLDKDLLSRQTPGSTPVSDSQPQ